MEEAIAEATAADAALPLTPSEALTRGFVLAEATAAPARRHLRADEALWRQGFRVGELRLMVRYEDGSELTELPPVCRLPKAPPWFWGMVNLHGTLVAVFDLCEFFGIAHATDAKRKLLVLGHGAQAAGLVIDGLPQRLRLAPDGQLDGAAIPAVLGDSVDRAWRVGNDDWFDFRYAAMFDRLEAALTQ